MAERTELKIVRTNLEFITHRISSVPDGPTWFAQRLEEKAFISSSASALVIGWSNYDKVNKLMTSVMARISTTMDAEGDFGTFMRILLSNVALEDLARHLLNRYRAENKQILPEEMEEDEDLGDWSLDMQLKTKNIPDSTEKYKHTCNAIGQLQEFIQETLDRFYAHTTSGNPLPFPSTDLLTLLRAKQEQLFQGLVHFHTIQIAGHEHFLKEAEVGLEETTRVEEGYIAQQQLLLKLRDTRDELAACEEELQSLMEAPQPISVSLGNLEQQTFDSATQQIQQSPASPLSPVDTTGIYSKVTAVHNSAEVLLIRCQGINNKLAEKIERLESDIQNQKDRFLGDLNDVERWLSQVYAVLCQEPPRNIGYLNYYSDGEQSDDDGVVDDRVKLELADLDMVQSDEEFVRYSDPGDSFCSTDDVITDDSLGSGGDQSLESPVDREPALGLETSVDVDLEDDEYEDEVMKRIFSPEPEESGSSVDKETPEATPPRGMESPEATPPRGMESPEATPPRGVESPVDPPHYRETEDAESVSSESTLRSEGRGGKSPDVAVGRSLAEEFGDMGVKVSPELSPLPPSEEVSGLPQDLQDGGLPQDGQLPQDAEEWAEEDPLQFEKEGGLEDQEREGDYALQWVKQLLMLPMKHRGGPYVTTETTAASMESLADYATSPDDIDGLISHLEIYLGQLSTLSHKVKGTMANINFVVSTETETANQLRERLTSVRERWEPLNKRLKHRIAQLKFEKAQKATLENLQEAVEELESQPTTNVLHSEIKDALKELMEFLISMEQFEASKEDLLSQLETTIDPLLEFPDEDHQLLRDTVDQIREAYETITEKVQSKKASLESWDTQWTVFESQQGAFEETIGPAEQLVSKEKYGYSLQETERYLAELKKLKNKCPQIEKDIQTLVDSGNDILGCVGEGDKAETHVDEALSSSTTRWSNLIIKLEEQESAVYKVLINWRAYTTCYGGTQSFISQMAKMVGAEPLESSNGNLLLLPTYRTYSSQVKAMQVQYDKLLALGNTLATNENVGGKDAIRQELENLKMQWEPLKDNVIDSLQMLQQEHDDWVKMKLQQMSSLVTEARAIVDREGEFVQAFPLERLLREDATVLLKEADKLVASHDQLTQLEDNCTTIETEILDRQIQQETTGHPAIEMESQAITEKRHRLQQEREDLQTMAESLLPVLNVFYLQLQLLQKIQEDQDAITLATDFVGEQDALEGALADVQLRLSEDHFEQLCSDAYDLGAVAEEYEAILEDGQSVHSFTIPPYDTVVQVNRSLTAEIEALRDGANAAMVRLQLFIEWWAEYHSNHDDMVTWMEEVESRLGQLAARAGSTQSPLVSPIELLMDAKELDGEVSDKSVLMNALQSTGQNIIDELQSKEGPLGEIGEEIPVIKTKWEAITTKLDLQLKRYETSADKLNSFVENFTGFLNWLSETHSQMIDEFCVQIPLKASGDTITRHRVRLEEFQREAQSHVALYEQVKTESEQWEEYLIPEERLADLPSEESTPSSPSTEEDVDFDYQLPFFKSRMKAADSKWTSVWQLLRERENHLEMSMGNMIVFLEGASELINWIKDKLQLDAVSAMPPANVAKLKNFLERIKVVRSELDHQVPVRLGLERSAESLKVQVAGLNAKKVEERVVEVREVWQRLEGALTEREKVLESLLLRLESLLSSSGQFEGWLCDSEAKLTDCGAIGANLQRLLEQGEILESLDDSTLDQKKVPEDIQTEAMNIISECMEGSGEELLEQVRSLQSRFDQLSQSSLENRELCEEATAAMQDFQKEFDSFSQWLESMVPKLAQQRETIKPIGSIQSEMDDHYDFVNEIEQQTDQYSDVYLHGNKLSALYKPSDSLDAMMSSLHHRWEDYVAQLFGRCDELLERQTKWASYEKQVKDLLTWIIEEAQSFSRDMTTTGDKGIVDHIESCKVLSESLASKKSTANEIERMAEDLRKVDGEKKNGTSDVESRWNDVTMHWSSLHKLLEETLLRLEATYAEYRQVLQIREEQFDWLEGCEDTAGIRRPTRGNLQLINEEIELHHQLLEEMKEHQNEAEFIDQTVAFLQEHSRKAQREEMADKAAEFSQRYQALMGSQDTYVHNLQDSIPIWKEFNNQSQGLSEWLVRIQSELESDRTQPGNAFVTKRSFTNSQVLHQDIGEHDDSVLMLSAAGKNLFKLCIPEDQEYVQEILEQIRNGTQTVSETTEERMDILDQRLKSWSVFPVEEAVIVQDFIKQAQDEVDADIAEDLSATELQAMIERLEALQEMQTSNEDKVSTIDQSAESEDVKKALESNPDISKERDNLLHGWSSMSQSLQAKIQSMKRKAQVTTDMERALGGCREPLLGYKDCVEEPLPPSVVMETRQQEMLDTMAQCHNSCQANLRVLDDVVDRYGTLETPAHLLQKTADTKEEFQRLLAMATERTNQITDTLASWRDFQNDLREFSDWLRSSLSELSSLRAVEMFLQEFSSLESRLQLLEDEIAERQDEFDPLKVSSDRHLFGEDDVVQPLRENFSRIERGWQSLIESTKALPEVMAPWKDLTDRFDELEAWFEDLERRVDQDLAEVEEQERRSCDTSDFIVSLKDHQLKMRQQTPMLQELNERAAALLTPEVCQQFEPAETLKNQCAELDANRVAMDEKLQLGLQDVEEKAARWKELANLSIREKKILEQRVQRQEAEIKELTLKLARAPRQIVEKGNGFFYYILYIFLFLLSIVAFLFFLVTVEPPPYHPL